MEESITLDQTEDRITDRITDVECITLNKKLESWQADALRWLTQNGWLMPGDGLAQLSQAHGQKIIRHTESFRRVVLREQIEAEEQQRREKERQNQRQFLVQRRTRWMENNRPIEMQNCSFEDAPRPHQYQLVSQFLTGDESLYFKPEGDHIQGLYLFGMSGTGKTATTWELVSEYWRSNPEDEVEFTKSVSFVGLAKHRHLDREIRDEFVRLFERLLITDLLVLDDLGTERLPESAEEVLFELIDTRTEEHRFTVISTNYDIATLRKVFPRNAAKIVRRISQFFLPVNFDVRQPANVMQIPKGAA